MREAVKPSVREKPVKKNGFNGKNVLAESLRSDGMSFFGAGEPLTGPGLFLPGKQTPEQKKEAPEPAKKKTDQESESFKPGWDLQEVLERSSRVMW